MISSIFINYSASRESSIRPFPIAKQLGNMSATDLGEISIYKANKFL